MNPYLFNTLEFGPRTIEWLMERIEPHLLDKPTKPGRFSPREVVAHMADWEPILRGRMQKCLEKSGSEIKGIDEGKRAAEQKYAESDWREQARLFMERRHETAQWLRGLKESDWEKFVVHNERGKQTLYDQANMLLGHDLYHIEQLLDAAGEKTIGTW
jgi:hypothetical protein